MVFAEIENLKKINKKMSTKTYDQLAEYRKSKLKNANLTKVAKIEAKSVKIDQEKYENVHVKSLKIIFEPLNRILFVPMGMGIVR